MHNACDFEVVTAATPLDPVGAAGVVNMQHGAVCISLSRCISGCDVIGGSLGVISCNHMQGLHRTFMV